MELLAIRLGEQTTLAKSLVMLLRDGAGQFQRGIEIEPEFGGVEAQGVYGEVSVSAFSA